MPEEPTLPPPPGVGGSPAGPPGWAPPPSPSGPATPAGGTPLPAPNVGAGAPPPPLAPVRTPWWRRRAAALPVAAWLAVGAVAIAGIVVAALVLGGDDDPKLAIDVPALTTAAPSPSPSAPPGTDPDVATTLAGGPASAPATATDTPPDSTPGSTPASTPGVPALGDGSTPAEPLPAGDPGVSTFTYADSFGAEWSGSITGVVETPLYWDDDEGERCFVVLGTLTPVRAEGLVSDSWSAPYLTLFLDGEEAELGELACATEALTGIGYRSLYDASATVGTDVAFFAEFSLPEAAGVPQAVAVGQGPDEWVFFDATLRPEAPPAALGAVGALPVTPAPVGPGAPGPFAHTDEYTGDAWSGSVAGLVEVPTDEYSEVAGRCYAVVGTLTADALGSGLTTSPYGAPPIGLIADGRLIDDYYGCSSASAEEAGYEWFNDTEITAGTSLAVYATLIVPEPFPGELQAIVVGDPWSEAPTVLAPYVLAEFPPATRTPGPAPAAALTPAGTPISVAHEYEESTWDVVVHGHVVTGDCIVVYARATLTEGEPDQAPPELFVIAGGRLIPEDFGCDTSGATGAGYVQQWDASGAVGTPLDVYAAFRIPPDLGPAQAVAVGRSLLAEPVAVAPTELGAIPPVLR